MASSTGLNLPKHCYDTLCRFYLLWFDALSGSPDAAHGAVWLARPLLVTDRDRLRPADHLSRCCECPASSGDQRNLVGDRLWGVSVVTDPSISPAAPTQQVTSALLGRTGFRTSAVGHQQIFAPVCSPIAVRLSRNFVYHLSRFGCDLWNPRRLDQ